MHIYLSIIIITITVVHFSVEQAEGRYRVMCLLICRRERGRIIRVYVVIFRAATGRLSGLLRGVYHTHTLSLCPHSSDPLYTKAENFLLELRLGMVGELSFPV